MTVKVKALLASVLLASTVSIPAMAVDKLYAPYVDKGEWEVEYFGSNSFDNDDTKDTAQKHEFSVGYGVTEYWKTEFYTIFEKEPQDHITFDALEWENVFQFTERGEYWLDAGGSLAYEWTPEDNHPDAIEARLLLAKSTENFTHILNLIAEKEVGSGDREDLEGGFIWSSRYLYSPLFQPGFEISSDFGELEETGSFDEQEHYIGPVAYGMIPLEADEPDEGLQYRVGYLVGVSDEAADGQLLIELEYELEF